MKYGSFPSHSYTKKECDAVVYVFVNVNTFCQPIIVDMLNFSP
jgi:hypothetical protein